MTIILPNFDFRDMLPMINRRKFRLPFIPSTVSDELGDVVDPLKWNRILKKYRCTLKFETHEHDHCDVIGEYDAEKSKMHLVILLGQIIDLYHLKFILIQTIMHEMIHANQDHSHELQYEKGFVRSEDEDVKYYSCFGEIQAYSHDAVLESFNGHCATYDRYKEMPEKVKKLFMSNTIRWLNKYKSYGIILKEPNEPNLRKYRQRT